MKKCAGILPDFGFKSPCYRAKDGFSGNLRKAEPIIFDFCSSQTRLGRILPLYVAPL